MLRIPAFAIIGGMGGGMAASTLHGETALQVALANLLTAAALALTDYVLRKRAERKRAELVHEEHETTRGVVTHAAQKAVEKAATVAADKVLTTVKQTERGGEIKNG